MRHARNNFSKETKRQAYARSNGICECHLMPHIFKQPCGLPLGIGNTFYEHVEPDRIGGRNDTDNAAVLTKTCWKIKTSTHDLPLIAKVKRNEDYTKGIKSDRSITGWKNFKGEPVSASRER